MLLGGLMDVLNSSFHAHFCIQYLNMKQNNTGGFNVA